MNVVISTTITAAFQLEINQGRKAVLQPLIDHLLQKIYANEDVNIIFICTHNSRRSHLCQIWAQIAAHYYNITNINMYSGGTEETFIFPQVIETLMQQGLTIYKVKDTSNPQYEIKYDDHAAPIVGFSKKYDHSFNPQTDYIAVLTCAQAADGCPFVSGADSRISITYIDPKVADHTSIQTQVYADTSLTIASEMLYVFSMLKSRDQK